MLPLLAKTGRVRLRRDRTQPAALEDLVPDLDPPWELAVGVSRGDDGKHWVLAGSLRRGDETVPLSQPVLIVPGMVVLNGRFCRFDDAGAYAWVPTLRRVGTITVPVAAADDLIGQILQMPRLPRLDLPDELRHTEVAVPPRPRLMVKRPVQHYGSPALHLTLSFIYDGETVAAESPLRGIFRADGKRFVLRDPAAERAAHRELTLRGARLVRDYSEQKLEIKAAQLPGLVRDLVPAGWMVEAEGKLYRSAGSIEVAVETGQDWFDLNGAANFEGRSVPFPRLLQALRRGETTVALDDGSLGLLPEDWLKRYGLIASMGAVDGDAIRFSKAQVGVLDALLASRPEVVCDKQFTRARGELRKFEGIAAKDAPPRFRGGAARIPAQGPGLAAFFAEVRVRRLPGR